VNKTTTSVYHLLIMVFTSKLGPHLLSLKFFLLCVSHPSNLRIKSVFFFAIVAGLEIFDSELLLNGIVVQKLEFER
jgi:hypothetical protein